VNPWRLQTWLGHKRIDETMLHVHVAEAHAREWPEPVHDAARGELDPDKRIVAMLGARAATPNGSWHGSRTERRAESFVSMRRHELTKGRVALQSSRQVESSLHPLSSDPIRLDRLHRGNSVPRDFRHREPRAVRRMTSISSSMQRSA
jgi:hypothetical protein